MPFPSDWGHLAREGLVVEFVTDTGETWVGNFRPGLGGIDDARQHPNGHSVLVVSAGSAWLVDPIRREASEVGDAIDEMAVLASAAFREKQPTAGSAIVSALAWCYTFDYK